MKATRITVERTGNFTTIHNAVLRDPRLSLKAVGLFVKVLSLPLDWDLSIRGLEKVMKEGRDAIYSAFAELIFLGYVERIEHRAKGGAFDTVEYVFREQPQQTSGSQPHTGFPYTGFPYTENPPQINTKEKKDIKEKKRDTSTPVADDVRAVFDHWVQVMGKNKSTKLTDNRSRSIRARLREGYDVARLKRAVDGCATSDFHMGKNDGGRAYNDLTLICRNGEKVEQFEEMCDAKKNDTAKGGRRYGRGDKDSVLEAIGAR